MKRLCCVAVCLLFVVLSGCEKNSGVSAVTSGISFTLETVFGGTEIICDAVIKEDGKREYIVVEPENIKGFTYESDGNETKIKFKELTYSVNSAPLSNVFCMIDSVFASVGEDKIEPVRKNKMYTFSGKNEYGKFKLVTGESGLPINAEIGDMKIFFKNIAFL